MDLKDFPWELRDLEPDVKAELDKYFWGNFVHVGPRSYLFGAGYKTLASDIYNLQLESSDVFVLGFPRSGTTWLQELVWLLENDIDVEKAKRIKSVERVPLLEIKMFYSEERLAQLRKENIDDEEFCALLEKKVQRPSQLMARLCSPRQIKSHLPLSLLPPDLLDTARVVYIARDPRDVAVSYYNFLKNDIFKREIDFKTFWNLFLKNGLHFTPYFENVKEAWHYRHHPRMLFLFYEELCKDLPSVLHRVANFLGKQLIEQQLALLCDYLSFSNLKNTESVNDPFLMKLRRGVQTENWLIRKGKVGGWRDYFDAEMTQEAERWIADNLRGTDLRFPLTDEPSVDRF